MAMFSAYFFQISPGLSRVERLDPIELFLSYAVAHVWFGMAQLHQVAFSESHSEERVCYPPWRGQVIKQKTDRPNEEITLKILYYDKTCPNHQTSNENSICS